MQGGGFTGLSGNIVIPMTADCADYEVYRTGKYVPGLMGTLFCIYGALIIGNLCNVVAMKFYSLTKEKMEEIQGKIAAIIEKAMQQQLM